MASLSHHTCLLSHSQDIEFAVAPDLERTTKDPFRARATFRLTISSCTPLGQRSKRVQLSAPIPLAADLNPKPGSSALPNSSTSEPMEPQPKRQCLDELAPASDAPLATVEPPLAAGPLVVAPPPAAEPFDASNLTISLPSDLDWCVFGNDPVDAAGIRSVLLARHSRGKAERMIAEAFPALTESRRTALVCMEAFNVWSVKHGGTKAAAIEDAFTTCQRLIELADEHGSDLRIWGAGRGFDRLIQCSMKTGWVDPNNMRPSTFIAKPDEWDRLGLRKTPDWGAMVERNPGGNCCSICLSSMSNGTATYRAELSRGGQLVTHFYLGNYQHPGSQSWGDVENRKDDHSKFLNDLADGTPSQTHIVKINADHFE